jgi:sulfate/thiosulfate transport system permease protein
MTASSRAPLRLIGIGYLVVLALGPLALVAYRTFAPGLGSVIDTLSAPDSLRALYLSALVVGIAVPCNTIFGVAAAHALARGRFPGRSLLGAVIDMPLAVSPVVAGLALLLVYGRTGWFGNWLAAHGIAVIFSTPGIVLATAFVSLPYVAREVEPVLREIGTDAEQAAQTLGASRLQTFWHVTLPQVRRALGYGVVLSVARGLGEFGAVSVVAGSIAGRTQTLPLYVQDRFTNFDLHGAYAVSLELAALALAALIVSRVLASGRKEP